MNSSTLLLLLPRLLLFSPISAPDFLSLPEWIEAHWLFRNSPGLQNHIRTAGACSPREGATVFSLSCVERSTAGLPRLCQVRYLSGKSLFTIYSSSCSAPLESSNPPLVSHPCPSHLSDMLLSITHEPSTDPVAINIFHLTLFE